MQDCRIQIKRTGNGWLISRNFNEDVDVVKDGEGRSRLLQVVSDMMEFRAARVGSTQAEAGRPPRVCITEPVPSVTGYDGKIALDYGDSPNDRYPVIAYTVPEQLQFIANNGEIHGPSPEEVAGWLVSVAADLGFDGFKIDIGDNKVVYGEHEAFYWYDCNNKKCDQYQFKVQHNSNEEHDKCPKCGKRGTPHDFA